MVWIFTMLFASGRSASDVTLLILPGLLFASVISLPLTVFIVVNLAVTMISTSPPIIPSLKSILHVWNCSFLAVLWLLVLLCASPPLLCFAPLRSSDTMQLSISASLLIYLFCMTLRSSTCFVLSMLLLPSPPHASSLILLVIPLSQLLWFSELPVAMVLTFCTSSCR